jgi:hypothetical protein
MLKLNIREIAAKNAAAGGHFFDRGTLRFFNDSVGNWDAFRIGDRVFIRNARHRGGRGMFAGCTLRGQVREISADGDISIPRDEFAGMTARQIEKELCRRADIAAAQDSIKNGESN